MIRVLFAGTPQFVVPVLDALTTVADVCAVLTAPDRPAGRRRKLTPSPVKTAALRLQLPILQPDRLDAAARAQVRPLAPDLLVVYAYGKIFPQQFLDLFPHGGVNVHPSLLPRHRGASPVPAAILAGDPVTGVSVQRLAREMDAGDIVLQREVPLDGSERSGELLASIAPLATEMTVHVVRSIADGTAVATPQDHDHATYCRLLTKADGAIDWRRPASYLERMVRAYDPWPGVYTTYHGEALAILGACPADREKRHDAVPGQIVAADTHQGLLVHTGDGLLAVTQLKPRGRAAMDWRSFVNGRPDAVGTVLGEET